MIPNRTEGKSRILIVDRCLENRQVLRTVLERRGATILEAAEANRGLEIARQQHPDVIILDLEEDSGEEGGVCAEYDAHTHGADSLLLVLGAVSQAGLSLPKDRIVAKPYHYGPLVRKIEDLLNRSLRTSTEPRGGVSLRHSRTRPGKTV